MSGKDNDVSPAILRFDVHSTSYACAWTLNTRKETVRCQVYSAVR